MSKAYQCDRCGNLFGGEPRSEYEHDARGMAYQAEQPRGELCDPCSKAFREFMNNV